VGVGVGVGAAAIRIGVVKLLVTTPPGPVAHKVTQYSPAEL
jgi:hypothetical protein